MCLLLLATAGAVQEMDTERLVRVIVGVMRQLQQRPGQLPSPAPAAPIQLELPSSSSSSSSMPPAVVPLTMGSYFPPTMGGVGAMMMPGIPQPLGMMGVGVGGMLPPSAPVVIPMPIMVPTPGPVPGEGQSSSRKRPHEEVAEDSRSRDGPLSLWHLEGLSDSEAQRLWSKLSPSAKRNYRGWWTTATTTNPTPITPPPGPAPAAAPGAGKDAKTSDEGVIDVDEGDERWGKWGPNGGPPPEPDNCPGGGPGNDNDCRLS